MIVDSWGNIKRAKYLLDILVCKFATPPIYFITNISCLSLLFMIEPNAYLNLSSFLSQYIPFQCLEEID